MKKPWQFHLRYLHWWIGVGLLRLLVLLPYKTQLHLGSFGGRLFRLTFPKRRHIADVNLKLCFPELSEKERIALRNQCFENIGMGFFEALIAWFMSDKRFDQIPFRWHGEENYLNVKANHTGILGLCGHFTCLEIMGRFFGKRIPMTLVYKRNKHPFIEYLIQSRRLRYAKSAINHFDFRGMVKALKQGEIMFYSPDQDFSRERSVFADFFKVPTATLRATSLLIKAGQATVIPAFFWRNKDQSYESIILPPPRGITEGSEEKDAEIVNNLIETYVRKHPAQYLWIHRRFKTRPLGMESVY